MGLGRFKLLFFQGKVLFKLRFKGVYQYKKLITLLLLCRLKCGEIFYVGNSVTEAAILQKYNLAVLEDLDVFLADLGKFVVDLLHVREL